jgi:hypothetical protein
MPTQINRITTLPEKTEGFLAIRERDGLHFLNLSIINNFSSFNNLFNLLDLCPSEFQVFAPNSGALGGNSSISHISCFGSKVHNSKEAFLPPGSVSGVLGNWSFPNSRLAAFPLNAAHWGWVA